MDTLTTVNAEQGDATAIFLARLHSRMDRLAADYRAVKDALVPFNGWRSLPQHEAMQLRYIAQQLTDMGFHIENAVERIER